MLLWRLAANLHKENLGGGFKEDKREHKQRYKQRKLIISGRKQRKVDNGGKVLVDGEGEEPADRKEWDSS